MCVSIRNEGVRELAPPALSLSRVMEEDEASAAVLLLMSPGADPVPELNALLASQRVEGMSLVEVSLGLGQVTQAEAALEACCKNGNWILLSNLQLALNWLPRLEALLRFFSTL